MTARRGCTTKAKWAPLWSESMQMDTLFLAYGKQVAGGGGGGFIQAGHVPRFWGFKTRLRVNGYKLRPFA